MKEYDMSCINRPVEIRLDNLGWGCGLQGEVSKLKLHSTKSQIK